MNAAASDATADTAVDYVRRGWVLVPVAPGSKRPRGRAWNLRENCISDPARAASLRGNFGLAHAYSKTCAIDFDRRDDAITWLKGHGIDAPKLLSAIDAVRISSGKQNSDKLLYCLNAPLPSISLADGALEFRCATKSGPKKPAATVQDLLPPSIHPDTHQHYRWVYPEPLCGEWRSLPTIPSPLLTLWESLLEQREPTSSKTRPAELGSANLSRLKQILGDVDPDVPYDEWVRIGMALHHEGGGSEEAFAIWMDWSAAGSKYKGAEEVNAKWRSFSSEDGKNVVTARSIFRTYSADDFDEDDDPRAVIRLVAGELHNHAEECEKILADDVYVRERALVRIGGAAELVPDGGARDRAQAVILPAGVEYLRRRLNQLVRFETYRRREKAWSPTDAPKDLVFNVAGQGDWPALRRVTTIARGPFVRADGSICEAPGYDPASFVFHDPNEEFPSVPEEPARDDALRALETLREPFREFPFGSDAAFSAFLANILTEVVRPAIDASPVFFYTAPTPGTGKSLLSEMPSRIVHGCAPAMRPWAESPDELRKGLFSSLLAGDRTIGYDNLPNGVKVRSPNLCLFLTADVYSDRKLGSSDVPAIPNRSVVFLTGNNITPTGDLARRALVVRLDANTTRLRDRTFVISDLREHITARRPELLVAALTIIKGFMVSEAATTAPALPSFERWSRLVRDPIMWLGLTDPVVTQDDEAEDEAQPLAEAFALIAAHPSIGEKEFTASDLAAQCDAIDDDDSLRTAIEAAGCSAAAEQRQVGYWLREKRDHIAGGFKLIRGGEARGAGRKWRLRSTS